MRTLILLILACTLIHGCTPGDGDRYRNCEFRPGDMVRSRVSGQVGQVIRMTPVWKANGLLHQRLDDWCYADVRFSGSQAFTESNVLSPDGPVQVLPLAVVLWMHPYELEHVAPEAD